MSYQTSSGTAIDFSSEGEKRGQNSDPDKDPVGLRVSAGHSLRPGGLLIEEFLMEFHEPWDSFLSLETYEFYIDVLTIP